MSQYPIIFSLSTVGIRHHFNQDYFIHPLRSDFNGNNGVGKSIIGDLLQLILVAKRNVWKSGTEGMDKGKRQIETMPLPRTDIQFAYAFMNIERAQGKFITIGVYVSSRSSTPVKPFIIHRGPEYSANATLISFDKPVLAADFLSDDTILDIDSLKRSLFEERDLHFHDFSRGEGIRNYHRILFRNKILPVDLSHESNLEMFANVIQSFSRAKSLEINKSSSLKKFIFPDREETYQTFLEAKEKLAAYIRDYHRLEVERREIEEKQQTLTALREKERKRLKAFTDFLEAQALYSWQQKERAQTELDRVVAELEKTGKSIEKCKVEDKRTSELLSQTRSDEKQNYKNKEALTEWISAETLKIGIENQVSDSSKVVITEMEKHDGIQKKLQYLKEELTDLIKQLPELEETEAHYLAEKEKLGKKLDELKCLHKAVDVFGNFEKLRQNIEERELFELKQSKLQLLLGISGFDFFEQSRFTESFFEANEEYEKRLRFLEEEIPRIEELIVLYDGRNPDSLFHWAVAKQEKLSMAEETVLMHFSDIWTKEISAETGRKYTLIPEDIFNSIREKEDGIWLELGPIWQFLPYTKTRLFERPDALKDLLESGKQKFRLDLEALKTERKKLQLLRRSLQEIGFNKEYVQIYKERDNIKNWTMPNGLPTIGEWEKWASLENQLPNLDKLLELHRKAVDRWNETHESRVRTKMNRDSRNAEIVAKHNELTETEEKLKKASRNIKNAENQLSGIEVNILAAKVKVSFTINNEDDKTQIKIDLEKKGEELDEQIKRYGEKIEEIQKQLSQLSEDHGRLQHEKISFSEKRDTFLIQFQKHAGVYATETNAKFNPEIITYNVDKPHVLLKEQTATKTRADYEATFTTVVERFEAARYSEKVKANQYDFLSLEEVLLGGKIKHLDNIGSELEGLNEELRKIAKGHLSVVVDVFKNVERKYKDSRDIITRLNHFFAKTLISGNYFIKLEFQPSDQLNIQWIDSMRQMVQDQKIAEGLFANTEKQSPEEIIQQIAARFCKIKTVNIKNLLDEKQYFNLKLDLQDSTSDQKYGGSHGQSYMAISLLCIGRLSIVEDKNSRPGIRFIIVEELANLDENNFNVFPRLAEDFGYQLITMTPKPFGAISEKGVFIHMLTPGKDLINYPPYSIFIKDDIRQEIGQYLFEEHGLETTQSAE